ncbi:MAG: hypothetical protein A3F10_05250 [Coxiella sp. RIFCSPHIGHO2_12_FULL_42_15]|nr:MAG: hypothetical protein A3F10_05250 [Coxiella sp. RIFCSPHIGHO2_12_FULL_42_15]
MKFIVAVITSALLLTGCHPNPLPLPRQAARTPTAQESLQLAAASQGQQQQYYLLQSAETALDSHQSQEAIEALKHVNRQQLSPEQQINYLIIQAQLALDEKQPQSALPYLQQAQSNNVALSADLQSKLQKLLAKTYFAMNDILPGLNNGSAAYQLATATDEKRQISLFLWQKLETLNPSQLRALQKNAATEAQRGWLDLMMTTKNLTLRNDNLLDAIKQWQKQYPHHAAQALLQNMGTRNSMLARPAQHIALLLPLNGDLGNQGRAIRNGFLAAYYQRQSVGYSPQISILDTTQDSIPNLYSKAVKEGADLVVGPLLKSDIQSLIASKPLAVPTIALNTVPNVGNISNLFFFGLDPDDEVQQVADKMRIDHRRRVLLMTPQDAWGQRIRAVFQPYWEKQGGVIRAEIQYHTRAQLANQLLDAFHLTASQRRYMSLRSILRKNPRFVPRRRDDFDAIFVVATPAMGRQIIPLLRFYYASDIPTYSTSQIYTASRQKDHDLDGVIFDDIPWLFTNNITLPASLMTVQQKIIASWPESYAAYPRLYALGADAFGLISKISQMSLLPNVGISSATGELFLEPNGKVYRRLVWARINNGKARLLSS